MHVNQFADAFFHLGIFLLHIDIFYKENGKSNCCRSCCEDIADTGIQLKTELMELYAYNGLRTPRIEKVVIDFA